MRSDCLSVQQMQYLRIKDWLVDGAMADASLAIVPTRYQASTFPERWKKKIAVVHEGVPETWLNHPRLQQLAISESVTLTPEVPVVTFISRNLEPMRGFPTFMHALPELQKCHPSVHVVIVGGDDVSYSSAPEDGRSWRQVLLEELGSRIDRSRLHLFGRIPHEQLQKLYRRSNLRIPIKSICAELEPSRGDGQRHAGACRGEPDDGGADRTWGQWCAVER